MAHRQMIRKANALEIANHWVLSASFVTLAVSGFAFLFHLEQIGSLFGGFGRMRVVHNGIGVVFLVSLFLSMFHYLTVALSFSADDREWIVKGGGYFSKRAVIPPQDIINTGQKLYYLVLLVLGYAVSASGLVIWLMGGIRTWMLFCHVIHNICFDLLIIIIPLHIYLGTLANPGTFRIMVYGTVPLEWARKRHAKWVKKIGY